MPGGDGTGPGGMGSMTGRGAGYCAGYPVPGYMNPVAGRGGFGYGRGGGRGRGWGRGRGRGAGWGLGAYGYPAYGGAGYAYGYPASGAYAPELSPKDEMNMLKDQAEVLNQQLKDIQNQIGTLQKAQDKK